MFSVINCIATEHSPDFVLLAAIICLLSCLTTASLIGRVRDAHGWTIHAWIGGAAIVVGGGTWATHFVAILGYTPDLSMGFDIKRTLISALAAVAFSWVAFLIALRQSTSRAGIAVGGVVLGLAISTMHYLGISGLDIAAHIAWSTGFVVASVVASIVFSVPAMLLMTSGNSLSRRLSAAAVLTIAVMMLHFTGMTAMTIEPDPSIVLSQSAIPADWIAVGIAITTATIIMIAITISLVDRRLMLRDKEEAVRLRKYVSQLEESQKQLRGMSEKLKAALLEASAANRAKTAFLAQTSHELRTPLNAVIGFAELMENQTFGPLGHPNYREYASDIRKSGQHLLGIISDILDIVRTTSGDLELATEEFDGKEIVDDVFRMMNIQALKGQLTFTCATPSGQVTAYGDRKRIKQILINLVSNAIKFTPAHGNVELSLSNESGMTVLRVSDTGIGMSAAQIPAALEHFGQIDMEHRRRYDGLGIGLPLSKSLAELHGGHLEIESTPGKGTVVSVYLPQDAGAEESHAAVETPEPSRAAS
ncbi:ATP-binding protein [Parvibaculum sp. MBR-TMA-1.3b-4.2]